MARQNIARAGLAGKREQLVTNTGMKPNRMTALAGMKRRGQNRPMVEGLRNPLQGGNLNRGHVGQGDEPATRIRAGRHTGGQTRAHAGIGM